MTVKDYFLKSGYRTNSTLVPYDDTEEDSLTYQVDVYKYAAGLISEHGLRSVLDVGCGYGLKLKQFIAPLTDHIVGIDGPHAIEYCRRAHRFGEWFTDDIEAPVQARTDTFDLVISADVIEHLVDPDYLLGYIKRSAHPGSQVILSTPERDLRRGRDTLGPPQNTAHVREWNQSEFANYLSDRGFQIREHLTMDLKAGMATCQTVVGNFAR